MCPNPLRCLQVSAEPLRQHSVLVTSNIVPLEYHTAVAAVQKVSFALWIDDFQCRLQIHDHFITLATIEKVVSLLRVKLLIYGSYSMQFIKLNIISVYLMIYLTAQQQPPLCVDVGNTEVLYSDMIGLDTSFASPFRLILARLRGCVQYF